MLLVKPVNGDLVVTVYSGFYDIIITNTNDQLVNQISNLNGTSGKIENVFSDETLKNFADADQKANDLLSQNDSATIEISCICNDFRS
jgi:hypothetical protein